ncbi:MAG: hypothetical protein LV481_03165 [Methylacidiphilales bacterium]|nr:hypothetical protein [Candidatus Methylacidiphilales bacterium]
MCLNPCNYLWSEKTALYLSVVVALCSSPTLQAQQAAPAVSSTNDGWQQIDWLKPTEDQQLQTAAGTTFNATAGQDINDPATVVSSGSLWQEKYGLTCTQRMADTLSLSYETSAIMLNGGPDSYPPAAGMPAIDGTEDDLYQKQTAEFQVQPLDVLTLRGNVHDSSSDFSNPDVTTGTGFSAEGRLPLNSTLKLDINSDQTGADLLSGTTSHDTIYDAQIQQPLGKMPLTAVLKSHYEEITATGSPASRFPSLEQSLIWKPAQETTLQMGLRQQQYEESPGICDEFNQAIFADWSQTLLPDVSWHSYTEMMNSRGLETISPSTGTAPQANPPGSSPSLTSSLPVSFEDETLTFTTGPSFKLQKDLSASLEYSSRWDKNPQPGSLGEEQRLSLSLKGTF